MFAIAITLLVLDFAIHPPGSPLHQVLHIWPSFVAYLISFLTIGAAWLGHTTLTDRLARTDSVFLRLNLLLLLAVTFLPFPTGLVGEALREPSSERVFVTLYGATLLAIRLLGFALDVYADSEHLYARRRRARAKGRRRPCPSSWRMRSRSLVGLTFPVLAVSVAPRDHGVSRRPVPRRSRRCFRARRGGPIGSWQVDESRRRRRGRRGRPRRATRRPSTVRDVGQEGRR